MSAALIAIERVEWRKYEDYCGVRCNWPNWTGDAVSRALWLVWKAAYEARRAAALPFSRRQRRVSYRAPLRADRLRPQEEA